MRGSNSAVRRAVLGRNSAVRRAVLGRNSAVRCALVLIGVVLVALQAGITHYESTLGGTGGQPANFVDGVPVAGYDPDAEGFCWCAGQGGYGIETSIGMGRSSAALAAGAALPDDIKALGVTADVLSPERF